MPNDSDAAEKHAILQSMTTEAGGFYGLIVTVASSFLGGSLLFLEKIAPVTNSWTVALLIPAWAALIAAIACVAKVRYGNLESAQLALEKEYSAARKIDTYTRKLSRWSQNFLILGMTFPCAMGAINLINYQQTERKKVMSEQKNAITTSTEQKSISYGSLGGAAAQSGTSSGATQGQSQGQSQGTPAQTNNGGKK